MSRADYSFYRTAVVAGLALLLLGKAAHGTAADWVEVIPSPLIPTNLREGDQFGAAVAVGNDVIAVGAYLSDEDGRDSGAVYLFGRIGKEWKPFNGNPLHRSNTPGEWFGFDVAINEEGKVLVVGAPSPGRGRGKAFRYDLRYDSSKDQWEVGDEEPLIAQAGASGDEFGSAVAVGVDWIAVGARGSDRRAGRAYVFPISGGQPKSITSPNAVPGREFGQSVALSGTTLVVGEPLPGEDGRSPGAAYVFKLNNGSWERPDNPEAPPSPDGLAARSAFGYSVAVQGEKVIAGAPLADHSVGAVYRLVNETNWEALKGAHMGDQFGVAVGMSSDEIVIGARGAQNTAGTAYLYTWGKTYEPLVHGPKAKAEFGFGAAIRGDVLVVGAFKENGKGAAYVFEKKPPPLAQKVTLRFQQGTREVDAVEVEEGNRIPVKLVLEMPKGEILAADLTVTVQVRGGGTEEEEKDYSPDSVLIKFDKGSSNGAAEPVTIQTLSDCLDEEDETFKLTLDDNISGTELQKPSPSLAVKILDAGLAANLIVDPTTPLTTREPGTSATFSVQLACKPRLPVRVDLKSSSEDVGTVQSIPLWFTERNWSTAQEVQVTGKDNLDCVKVRPYSVGLETSSADLPYDGLTTSVLLRNLNDDICLTAIQSVCVNGGTVLYTVIIKNTGEEAYALGNTTIDELPDEITVVTASTDVGVATVDYLENTVAWAGSLPAGQSARIEILAQLEPVPIGTEVINRVTLPYDTDGENGFDATVETDEAVFEAGDIIPCPGPNP